MVEKGVRHFFKEGDEVAHKENIMLRMEVRRIIRNKIKAKKAEDKFRVYTMGIECGWWNGEFYQKEVFHTRSLIPWGVATQGYASVLRWLDLQSNVITT